MSAHSAEKDVPGRAMGSHHSHRAGTTTWLTPPHIIEALGPFDLDPCAAPGWVTAAANSGAPSCLVAYGTEAARRLEGSDLPGSFVSAWRPGTRPLPPGEGRA